MTLPTFMRQIKKKKIDELLDVNFNDIFKGDDAVGVVPIIPAIQAPLVSHPTLYEKKSETNCSIHQESPSVVSKEENNKVIDVADLLQDNSIGSIAVPSNVVVPSFVASNTELYTPHRHRQHYQTNPNPIPILCSSSNVQSAPAAKVSDLKLGIEQQKIDRRLRNNKHAKKSRLRKKFLLENLQEQIKSLKLEVECMQDIIKRECPNTANMHLETISGQKRKLKLEVECMQDIIKRECPNTANMHLETISGQKRKLNPSADSQPSRLLKPDIPLITVLSKSKLSFTVTDPNLPGNPFVYVSEGFLDLTGYTREYVLGKNGRFLQGAETDPSTVDTIRRGFNDGVDTSVCMVNYKADGTPFWLKLFVGMIRDTRNNIVNHIGVHCEVSKAVVDA